MQFNLPFFKSKKPIVGRFFGLCVLGILSGISASGVAAFKEGERLLNIEHAISNALSYHPELATYEYRLKSMDGKIQQSQVGQRKEIGVAIENILGSGDYSAAEQAQTTLSIAWVLENNWLDARSSTEKLKKSLVEIEQDIKKIDIAAQTARLFLTALYFQEQKKLSQQWHDDLSAMHENSVKRVRIGNSSSADQYRAEAELSLSELAVEDAEHEINTSYKQLVALWGESQVDFQYLNGNIYTKTGLRSFESMTSSIKRNRRFMLLSAREKIARSEIGFYRVDAKNKWKFNTGVRHHAGSDSVSMVAGVAIPFGGGKRNRGKISSLESDILVVQSEAKSLEISLETELYALYEAHNHALHVIRVLNKHTIPALERALKETQNAYDIGRSSFQDWIVIQKELIDSQSMLLGAFYSAHLAQLEVERITGLSATTLEIPNTSMPSLAK